MSQVEEEEKNRFVCNIFGKQKIHALAKLNTGCYLTTGRTENSFNVTVFAQKCLSGSNNPSKR